MPDLGRKSPMQMALDNHPSNRNVDGEALASLENRVNKQFQSINETLLALATHIQNQEIVEPSIVQEELREWNPRKSSMYLWDKDQNGISWENRYKGGKVFLVCGGPSLNDLDLSLMDNRGVMSMCINNSWSLVKPDFWIGFDSPGRFYDGGWMDPSIIKFVPWQNREQNLNHREGDDITDLKINTMDAPNCWFLSNNTTFNPETWFTEKSANWGGPIKGVEPEGGFRVTMFGALRLLYYLGFQEVYLLGCDWEMNPNMEYEPYAWEEDRSKDIRVKNNNMYKWMEGGLKLLQPGFDEANFQIYNCNPHSKLSLFPHVSYEDAIERSTFPEIRGTRGWYESNSSNYPKELQNNVKTKASG